MKIVSKIKNLALLLPMVAGVAVMQSCQDEIDTSARYTFTGNTVISYLQKHSNVYSEYCALLDSVNISDFSDSKVSQLLSARGNYTCFAPTNEAIQNYLEELKAEGIISEASWDAPEFHVVDPETGKKELLEEKRRVIVYNSIIDAGDEQEAYQSTYFSECAKTDGGTVAGLPNMMARKLIIAKGDSTNYTIQGCPISDTNCNIYTINGYIHQVTKVIAPNTETTTDMFTKMIKNKKHGMYTYAALIQAIGLTEELSKTEDEEYYRLKMTGQIESRTPKAHSTYTATGGPTDNKGDSYGIYPERRYYGYTLFIENDTWWEQTLGLTDSITAYEAEEVVEMVAKYVADNKLHLSDAKVDNNYTNVDNALNQFVTYHILPAKVENSKLVIHFNEYGYNHDIKNPTVCVYDYYTTMGKRRLLKTFKAPQRNTIYLNRFPIIDNATDGTYKEIGCDAGKEGIEIDLAGVAETYNAYIYPVNGCLFYNEQTAENLGKERIRIDVATMFNEFITNNIRSNENESYQYQCVGLPISEKYNYVEDLEIGKNTLFFYLSGRVGKNNSWANYQGDELCINGNYELTWKLPPVPKDGIYELRMGLSTSYLRGMTQVYWGTNKNALPAAGIPVDIRMQGTITEIKGGKTLPSIVGWEADVKGDDDVNAEIDKKMRNNWYMKGPKYVHYMGEGQLLRDRSKALRRIIVREHMKADETYYIQFRSVLDDDQTEFFVDYFEFCPKEVYDNPLVPEDIW